MPIDFSAHADALLRFALNLTGNRADAEDLVQETFVRSMKSAAKGSNSRAGTEPVINERAWLFKIVLNQWRDQCRQKNRRPKIESLSIVDPNPKIANPRSGSFETDSVADQEQLTLVLEAFQKLPERQRQILFMRTVEGFSIPEIVSITGLSNNNVKTNLSLARKAMRQMFPTTIRNPAKS